MKVEGLNNLTKKQRVAIFLCYKTALWCEVALAVKKSFESAGKVADVIDCTRFAFPRRSNITNRQMNIENVHHLKFRRGQDKSKVLPRVLSRALEEASVGALKSFLRDDQPRNSCLNTAYKNAMKTRASALYFQAKEIIAHNSYDEVVVPNGRFVHEKALLFAANELNVKISNYEIGTSNRSYTLSNYPPQSRVGLKLEYENSKISSTDSATEFVLNWLKERKSHKQANAFANLWSGSEINPQENFRNAFFTSSSDEIGALDSDWRLDFWDDQYDAFDCILYRLERIDPDGKSALRVHPNLINKSSRMYKREVQRIRWLASRHPALHIFWHSDPQNSYTLIEKSNRVFVSLSSIGIEATLMRKPVWVTSASHYDESIAVKGVLSMENLLSEDFTEFSPDFENAVAFKNFELNRQTPLSKVQVRVWAEIFKYFVYPIADLSFIGFAAFICQIRLSALSASRNRFFLLKNRTKVFFSANRRLGR